MGFYDSHKTFQEKCWSKLYSELLVDFFNNFKYVGSEFTITCEYSPHLYEEAVEDDYNKSLLRKESFVRELHFQPNIESNVGADNTCIVDYPPLLIPEYTPRGFIIDGHTYDIANRYREAYGWYITLSKKGEVIISLKTRYGGKYIIYKSNDQLMIEHNNKKIGFGVFLKAVTKLDSGELRSILNVSNVIMRKTLEDQLQSNGKEKTVYECILEAVYLTSSKNVTKESLRSIRDSELRKMLDDKLASVDIGSEGFERYKKFITFQRRAEGSILFEDKVLTNGVVIRQNTNLSRIDLKQLDADESIREIKVLYNDNTYCIKKFPLDDGKFNENMLLNIASIASATFSGLFMLDDRDSLENRVIENVAVYIVELVHKYIYTNICRVADSYRNRSIVSASDIALEILDRCNRNYILHSYKQDSIVQLKDDVNILSEITKTYKLSYKKNSAKSHPSDAVRNIKVKQYMRVCPIDTPESKEVGLNTYLTATAGVDENGFITAKYVEIETGKVVDMNALDEMGVPIMVWDEDYENNEFVRAHIDGEFVSVHKSSVKYMDVGPSGLLSLSTGYIPFIGHNKTKRALMATNMNRQAVHMLGSQRPLVTTATDNLLDVGIFRARDIVRDWAVKIGVEVTDDLLRETTLTIVDIKSSKESTGSLRVIRFMSDSPKLSGIHEVSLSYFMASASGHYSYIKINEASTTFKYSDIVYMHRDIMMDNVLTMNEPNFGKEINIQPDRINECGFGLGRDLKILFKIYKGFTYEDAVVLNRDLFENKSLTSIYLTEVEAELRDDPTSRVSEKFGISELNFTFEERRYMCSNGLPAIGSYIKGGQVVIGKIRTGDEDLSNRKVENGSVYLDSQSEGWVIDAKIIKSIVGKNKSDQAVVSIVSFRDVKLGDKFVGRHGNKGVVAKIVPAEDLPFFEDGTIPDMVLNPLGTIARGNVGQLLECLVGIAGYKMNKRIVIPTLSEENYQTVLECQKILEDEYGFKEMRVYNGETGLPYGENRPNGERKMLYGVMHMYKLYHLAERNYRVTGAAGNSVQEMTQQPREGQRISELQVNSYIAHGATETLHSFFSTQSDDIKSGYKLQKRIKEYGESIEGGIDIHGDNKSDDIVKAYLRALGVDIISVDGGIRFKYLTDDDILDISGNGTTNVVSSINGVKDIEALHSERIFGAESKKESRSQNNRVRRRLQYGRIEFGYKVIMPIIFRNSYFLDRFNFIKWEFGELKITDEDKMEYTLLKVSCSRENITTSVVKALITGGYSNIAFNTKSLSFVDVSNLNSLSMGVREEAENVLKNIGFNISELKDKNKSNTYFSSNKISALADMFYNYNSANLTVAQDICNLAYMTYKDYLLVNVNDFGIEESKRFEFVSNSMAAINSMSNAVGIDGSQYFVSNVLVMPSSFRPRFQTTHGERYNDVDAAYIKIMSAAREVNNRAENGLSIEYDVVRLYQALDECYVKRNDKDAITIASMLLASKQDKRSTVIRGHVGAKRVSYSSGAVITVNPTLKLTECGIPYKQALVLWEDNLIFALNNKQIIKEKTALNEGDIHKLIMYLVDGNYYAIGYDLLDIHTNPIGVAKQVEDIVVKELVTIMSEEVVVLSREPALHKFNCLAFIPVLCEGISIQLHPMVCAAYNADFDGDRMSNIVCKCDTAKREAREKMMTTNNIINPQDGKNILAIKQDIVLGIYMLTKLRDNNSPELNICDREPVAFYNNISVLEMDIDVGSLSIYDYVAYTRRDKRLGKDYMYVSTAGRILFNSILSYDKGFTATLCDGYSNIYKLKHDERINSKKLNSIVVEYFEDNIENRVTIELLDRIKEIGIKYADESGISISINDFEDKSYLVDDDIAETNRVVDKYNLYEKLKLFPSEEKRIAVVDLWKNSLENIHEKIENSLDPNSSVFAIIDSGARGDKSDYNAISGVVGQVRNIENEIIERPVLGNYLKGLTADEYFISTYQARRGQISTSTKTADSGENNRMISQMLNNVKVVMEDCGAEPYDLRLHWGAVSESVIDSIVGKKITNCKYNSFIGKTLCKDIPEGRNKDGYLTIKGLELTQLIELELDGIQTRISRSLNSVHKSLLYGRVVESGDNEWLPDALLTRTEHANNEYSDDELTINNNTIKFIEDNPHEYIRVRLLMGCKAHNGVCSKCYGRDIETKKLIEIGKYIGLIAATSISEVATQGTMDVHHMTASASGMGSIAKTFRNNLTFKSNVEVTTSINSETKKIEYSVKVNKGNNEYVTIADKLPNEEAVRREQGLALADGIIHISNRVTADGKIAVQLYNNDSKYEYYLYKNKLLVADGEEVFENQPLAGPYDYNQILNYDFKYGKEFYILDFAGMFINGGNNVRAIHFELLGREQASYNVVRYALDGNKFEENFNNYLTAEEILGELRNRYGSVNIELLGITPKFLGKSGVMSAKDVVAYAFSGNVFDSIGKLCMTGKVDNCTSYLSNLYVGKEPRGRDSKVFSTIASDPDRRVSSRKPKYVDESEYIDELELDSDELSSIDYDDGSDSELPDVIESDLGDMDIDISDIMSDDTGEVKFDEIEGISLDGDGGDLTTDDGSLGDIELAPLTLDDDDDTYSSSDDDGSLGDIEIAPLTLDD